MRNLRTLYRALIPQSLTWSVLVTKDVKLAGMLLRSAVLVYGKLSNLNVRAIFAFSKRVSRIYTNQGGKGLALYLKTCYVVTQHIAGGMKDASPRALGTNISRTRKGLPRILPLAHRVLIRSGDVQSVRLWLTLFGLYRVVEFKGKLKLQTITDAGADISAFREGWIRWVPTFYDKARGLTGDAWKVRVFKDLDVSSIPFIRKSSPNSSGYSSVMALPWDVISFGAHLGMRSALVGWLRTIDSVELIWGLKSLWKILDIRAKLAMESPDYTQGTPEWNARWLRGAWPGLKDTRPMESTPLWSRVSAHPGFRNPGDDDASQASRLHWYLEFHYGMNPRFGRLGFKEEPGKIRVFAMVSVLTQAVMQPLHNWIFTRLRMIPTDGTFDQTAPVERLIASFAREGHWVASYDLSAATDRLPLTLQKDLLEPLLGTELVELWAYLLVGTPYDLPKAAKSWNLGFNSVRYAVGQPMGALSSWAMLALTHHALVQYAAFRVRGEAGWFMLYAVLGDDVVIADRLVAAEYLKIMREIGVEISLAKSLVSNTGSLEFAKRTWIKGRDATPISLEEILVALRSLGAMGELVSKNMKFGVIRLSSVARFAGFGYRNLARLPAALGLGNRLEGLIAYLCRPGGEFSMPLEAWLTNRTPGATTGVTYPESSWRFAERFWGHVLGVLLNRLVKFEQALYGLSMCSYTSLTRKVDAKEADVTAGRAKRVGERLDEPFFTRGNREFFSLDNSSWDTFFTEWVAYPFTNKLRKVHEKIDDRLRVLAPHVLPGYQDLADLWTQVSSYEDGVNLLPQKVDYVSRLEEDIPPSARLISLWRYAAKKVRTKTPIVEDVRKGFVEPRVARRRRRGA